MKHRKTYADMERHPGDMTDFQRPAYSVRHPDIEYGNIQNADTAGEAIQETPIPNRRHSVWLDCVPPGKE